VLDDLDKDADKKKRELLQRLQRNGVMQLSREEQERFMSELDDNLNKIGEVLQRDEQDQEDMLRNKLAERANRRRKMQDKLKEQEKIVEQKQTVFNEKKQEVEA
jgi:Asp-tRNA(Asn)/Glu-tRNA(Gln) amidotransferase C subunit